MPTTSLPFEYQSPYAPGQEQQRSNPFQTFAPLVAGAGVGAVGAGGLAALASPTFRAATIDSLAGSSLPSGLRGLAVNGLARLGGAAPLAEEGALLAGAEGAAAKSAPGLLSRLGGLGKAAVGEGGAAAEAGTAGRLASLGMKGKLGLTGAAWMLGNQLPAEGNVGNVGQFATGAAMTAPFLAEFGPLGWAGMGLAGLANATFNLTGKKDNKAKEVSSDDIRNQLDNAAVGAGLTDAERNRVLATYNTLLAGGEDNKETRAAAASAAQQAILGSLAKQQQNEAIMNQMAAQQMLAAEVFGPFAARQAQSSYYESAMLANIANQLPPSTRAFAKMAAGAVPEHAQAINSAYMAQILSNPQALALQGQVQNQQSLAAQLNQQAQAAQMGAGGGSGDLAALLQG